MAILIDANAFEEHHCNDCPYRREGSCTKDDPICSTIIDLKDFPTVDAVEVVHGRWVDSYGGKYANPRYVCSECKKKAPYKFEDDELHIGLWVQELTDYCPNCGAKMDAGEAIQSNFMKK